MANGRDKVEAVTEFIFLDSEITVDGDWSHEIKTFAPWKENHDKPRQHVKKQKHHFANKVHMFPVVMYKCESWTTKKAEH